MAVAAVSVVLNQLSVLLREEQKLLGGLEREVESIRDEMGQMNEFLRVAVENDASNSTLKEWIRQLQEIAYDVEDVLDNYMLRFRPRRGGNGFKKVYASIKNLKACHHIASEIQAINYRLQKVSTSQQRYRDMYANMNQGSSSTLLKNECYDGQGDALFLDEDDVVGIHEPKKQLLEWIHSMDDGLEVISVVGMGGLGKTTLVKKVYDEESVKRHFDSHVWIVTSEYNDVKHLLSNLIEKLLGEMNEPPPQTLGGMNVDNMREFINEFLKGKNYVIVLDDVWNVSTWEAIRFSLPKRGAHGCVIIATRFYDIGKAACSTTGHVYRLEPLPEEQSRELFYKKAFPINPCPHYIREFAEKIIKRCEGLPLAISVIGGLLATKDNNIQKWEMFERSLGHELTDGGSLEILWKSLISLGYNDLPYYLKYCYLYFSIFLEDRLLEKETIIRLWIAEGFVQPKQDKTMEEVASHYLSDLSSRSLIQVADRHVDGRSRSFRIHDLLRDYIIAKSREHNIVTISSSGEEMHWSNRIRRFAIQKSFSFSKDTYKMKFLRSLILLCSGDMELGVISELIKRCRLVKVLDLRGAPLEVIPNQVFKLYYLKYLSLRNTMVRDIPKSIKYLVNLETLDLKNCYVMELPKEILELHRLRHLLVYSYRCAPEKSFDYMQGFKAPHGIGRSLPLLLKLSCIDADESGGMKKVREIGKLTRLRRLCITKLRSEDGKELCSSIVKLTNLRSLSIYSFEEGEKLDLDYLVSLPLLRALELCGCIERIPEWVRSLNGLTKLGLCWCKLKEDPLNILQDLPNLARLTIHGAYVEGLRFEAQGFKKLKKLYLGDLKCLEWVIVDEGCMPSLQEWHMIACKLLEELPQDLGFANMGDEFVERVVEEKNRLGYNWRLAHVPNIRFFNETADNHWNFAFALEAQSP